MALVWVVPVSGVLAVLFALFLARDVLRRDPGTPKMQEIGGMIFEGAMAFLKRQYSTIGLLALVTAGIIGGLLGLLASPEELEGLQLSRWGLLGYSAPARPAGAERGHHRGPEGRGGVRVPYRSTEPPGGGRHLLPLRRPGPARYSSPSYRGLWFWGQLRGPLRPAGRGYLHQGGGHGGRPGGHGGGGDARGE